MSQHPRTPDWFAVTGWQRPGPDRSTGDAIRIARVGKSLTQADLADHVGAHPITVHRWEHGLTRPTNLHRGRIERLLDITL